MTNEKKERIKVLEKELAPVLGDANGFDEKYDKVNKAVNTLINGRFLIKPDNETYTELYQYKSKIYELSGLYDELIYKPDKDEKTLAYLFHDGMSTEEKLKALADAWWYATNSGYSDAMANRLMAGQEDAQTQLWEMNCSNKSAIDRYYDYLKESAEND